ncbi:conserved hypothetical protein [delta proteobacterium NaphS2]|nr:conserved hypothetical protein [delta proteobacterium NaphS2]
MEIIFHGKQLGIELSGGKPMLTGRSIFRANTIGLQNANNRN